MVPRKFECQPDRKRRTCSNPRTVAEKRQKRAEINEIFAETFESSSTNVVDVSEQNTTAVLNKPAINELILKSPAEQIVCEIDTDTRRGIEINTDTRRDIEIDTDTRRDVMMHEM